MEAKILWIEGKRAGSPHFVPGLRKKGLVIEYATSGAQALETLPVLAPDLVVINTASMQTTGRRISQAIRNIQPQIPILRIANDSQKEVIDPSVNLTLTLPFTSRKLVNRIQLLLAAENPKTIHRGPIGYNPETRRVECEGRRAWLNPHVAKLLVAFMEHPGEVLERHQLFSKVWKTQYTADMRTLDVHISWLRQAIEEDPHEPRFLKTVRGVGYRLDV
jgi:DNA-binding response OmpR family regulator